MMGRCIALNKTKQKKNVESGVWNTSNYFRRTILSSIRFWSFTDASTCSAMSFIVTADPRRCSIDCWLSVSNASESAIALGSAGGEGLVPNKRFLFLFCILCYEDPFVVVSVGLSLDEILWDTRVKLVTRTVRVALSLPESNHSTM